MSSGENTPDLLGVDRLSTGLFVEYLGETSTEDLVVGAGYPPPVCDRLWHGHPGVVADPTVQHVQVTWAGLEDAAVSFGVGHSCDDSGYYGLGVLTAAEYGSRRRRVLAGQSPLG